MPLAVGPTRLVWMGLAVLVEQLCLGTDAGPDGAVGTWTLLVNKTTIVDDPVEPTPSHADACAMWVPPGVTKARGVVLSASLIPEQFWRDDSPFRKAVADAKMVAIILNCSASRIHQRASCAAASRPCNQSSDCTDSPCSKCDQGKCVDKHPQTVHLPEDNYVPKTLSAFAKASGMPEVATAPIFAMGWSAAGPFAMHVAYALPTKTAGFLYYHSGTMACPLHFANSPGCAQNSTFASIPFLAINGECEQYGPGVTPPVPQHMCEWMPPREMQWKAVRESMEIYRRNAGQVQLYVTTMNNHTTCLPAEVQYAATYLAKVAAYRIPAGGGPLVHIKEESGWLTDMNLKPNETHVERHAAASFAAYTGNKTEASWHFDEELARAYERAEATLWDPKRSNDAFWDYCKKPPTCNGAPCCPSSALKSHQEHTSAAPSGTVSVSNHNKGRTYVLQPVRLQADVPLCHGDTVITVTNVTTGAGAPVPAQIDEQGHVWIAVTMVPGAVHHYVISCGDVDALPAVAAPSAPSVVKKSDVYVLSNSEISLSVPAVAAGKIPPPPFKGMAIGSTRDLLGSSSWNTTLQLTLFTASIEANGPVFARVKLSYVFKSEDVFNISFTLGPADKYATVDETFAAGSRDSNDAWNLHLSTGVRAARALLQSTHQCNYSDRYSAVSSGDATKLINVSLHPNERYGNSLGYFFYRWNQGCDSKGIVGSADEVGAGLGVVAVRGGKWVWPAGTGFSFSELGASLATIAVKPSGDYLGLRLPIYVPGTTSPIPGRRVFLLSPYSSFSAAQEMPEFQQIAGFQPLDKLVNEYVLDWPGVVAANETQPFPYFLGEGTNPTAGLRGQARNLNKNILAGKTPTPSLGALVTVNSMFDPDWYGLYRGYVSPENNNFATDFMRPAILTAVGMIADNSSIVQMREQLNKPPKHPKHPHVSPQKHPYWKRFVTMVQQAFQMDLFHSITMPSGATQEAPGYLGHAMEAWLDDAPIYRQYFGFDPIKDARLLQAVAFQFQLAHPFNYHMLGGAAADPSKWANRYITPIGDTHPNSVNYTELIAEVNFSAPDPSTLRSLDLAGFGSVLRSQPGTANETFLSFKAGPNQGHDHGDQLSIHWCAYGARHAIDLMFGYKPRPLQEFWHNRMSFGLNGQLQNMDGYARQVASKYSAVFDVAVGMVSSRRLRTPPLLPPGIWAADYPYTILDQQLNYTRTSVLVKQSPGRDYVVLRDVFESPQPVNYVLNQFYMQDGVEVAKLTSHTTRAATVDLGNSTLFVIGIAPTSKLASPAFSTIRWTNESEGNEFATGVRVNFSAASSSDVVAVLYPAGSLSNTFIPTVTQDSTGTMSVNFGSQKDEFSFTPNDIGISISRDGSIIPVLKRESLNLSSFQGEVGLTTLDAGYDFGMVPDWLVAQRAKNLVYDWPLNPFNSNATDTDVSLVHAGTMKTDDHVALSHLHPAPSPQDQPRDIPVYFSTYLSEGSNATSVQVIENDIVAVGGSFPSSNNFGLQPTQLLQGTTGGVLFISADKHNTKIVALTRIGARVDDLSCENVDGETLCAVVGAHGAAMLKVDTNIFSTSLQWAADLPVYSGERYPTKYFANYSYGVCSGWIYNWDYGFHPDGYKPHFCRTDIGSDGTVVVSAAGHHGYTEHQNCTVRGVPGDVKQCQINFWPVFLFSSDGHVLFNTTIDDKIVYDVSVDSKSKTLLIAGYNQSIEHTPKFKSVVQIGFLDALDYSGDSKWSAWGFDQDTIGGLLADTRIMHVTSSGSSVYLTGWTSGGDTIFSCDPQDISTQQHLATKIDQFSSLGGVSAQVALYVAELELTSGKKLHEQYMHASSPPHEAYKHEGANPKRNSTMGNMISGLGNSLAVGSEGEIFVAGFTDCCIAYRENGTVGGQAPGEYIQQPEDPYSPNQAESVMLQLNANMSTRTAWNSWMQTGVSTLAAVHASKSLVAVVGNVESDSSATVISELVHNSNRKQPAALVAAWPVASSSRDAVRPKTDDEATVQSPPNSFRDGEYTVWLMQSTNNTQDGNKPYGHMGSVELHMHREDGKWDDFVMVWTDFEWASFASYDYTYSFAKLTDVIESNDLFTGHIDITLNRDVAMSGALLSYNFSFSLGADKSDGPTSCVHTACDPCKDAGKASGCPRSCSCLPQEGVPPPGVPGSFCGPCSPGTTMVVVGNFSGTYDDCDTTIYCPRGRNDLTFAGNHLRLEGNVTLAPHFALFKPLWPSQTSDVQPAMQNEHPRLLFRKSHIPQLQAAATTSVGSAYRERLDQSLRTNFSVWQPAGYCLRYLLSGNASDAATGETLALKVAQGSPDTLDPRYGLKLTPLRVGPTMWALGLAYDLCYDAWSTETRQTVADSLLDLASRVSMMDSGIGCVPDKPATVPPPTPCNGEPADQCVPYNHFCTVPKNNHTTPVFAAGKISRCGNHLGAITGGGLMGLLSVLGDDVVKHSKNCNSTCLTSAVKWSIGVLRMHLTIDWGDHGACTTDVGPGHVSANTGVLPVLQSLRTSQGLDFFEADARASWILPWWTTIMVANPSGPSADYVHRGHYEPDQPWDGDNEDTAVAEWSHQLSFLLGMGVVNASGNSSAVGAMLWVWNNYIESSLNTSITKTYGMGHSPYSAAPLYGLVNWPELYGVEEINPEKVFGLNIIDEFQSYYVLRNRFLDSNDAMVTFMPGGRGGKRGSVGGSACYDQLGGLTVWALGLRYSAVIGGSKYGARDSMPETSSLSTKAFLAALGHSKGNASSTLGMAKRETFRQLQQGGGGVLSFADDTNGVLWSLGVDYSGKSGAPLVFVLTSSGTNASKSWQPAATSANDGHIQQASNAPDHCTGAPAMGNVTSVEVAAQTWFVMTIQCGAPPKVSTNGDVVNIGKLTASFAHAGHVVFA